MKNSCSPQIYIDIWYIYFLEIIYAHSEYYLSYEKHKLQTTSWMDSETLGLPKGATYKRVYTVWVYLDDILEQTN